MSKEELTGCIDTMFQEIDTDNTGVLSRAHFVQALQAMELGLTRRELNAVMFQVDVDQDGFVSYREFTRFAFELLQKLTSMRLLESEMESDQFAQYLADLLRSRDMEGTGVLKIEQVDDDAEIIASLEAGLSALPSPCPVQQLV